MHTLMHVCVCFCLCLVCIFFQCTYFQNIFPPGSLQAVETLLEISPVSFIMLLLPLAFFPFAEGVIWASLTFVAGYYFRYCIKVHLICCPNFPRSRRSIIGEMFQKSSKHERGNEPRRMCPKNSPWEMEASETKAEIRLEGWEEAEGETERKRGESRWAMGMLTFPPRCQNKINPAAPAPLAGSDCRSISCPINMSEQTN